MYFREDMTDKTSPLMINGSDFHVEKYRNKAEYQELPYCRDNAVTDCIRKALRVMGVRDEVEAVLSQRADLSDLWLSCNVNLGDEQKGDPFEVWAIVKFTFFPDSNNPNDNERVREKLPIFGEVVLENLGEAVHLRELDLPRLGRDIASRLVNRTLLAETIEGENLLVITSEDDDGNLIYGERKVSRMCSLGFATIDYKKEILAGEEVFVEHREFYSWVDVVGE
ncbi:MAG: hypothetical protein CL512_04850 [Actinobacteria bacterium]|nr:hypothetical protein [Actinomycetota bacterium]